MSFVKMQLWSDNACKCFVINLFIIHFIYLIKSHWKLSGFYMIFTHLVQGNYSHAKIQQTCLNVHLSAYATLCKSRYECKDHWNDCIRDSTTRDTKYDCSFVCIDFFFITITCTIQSSLNTVSLALSDANKTMLN